MYSLVTCPFSQDFMKTEIDQLKYQQCFNLGNDYLHLHCKKLKVWLKVAHTNKGTIFK